MTRDEYIKQVVDQAPTLTPEQRDRIAMAFARSRAPEDVPPLAVEVPVARLEIADSADVLAEMMEGK